MNILGGDNQLQIGQKLNEKIKINDSSQYLMSNSGSIEKTFVVVFNGSKFNITLNKDKPIKAKFTNDKQFSIDNSIKVGMTYGEVKNRLINNQHTQPGWAKYFDTKVGWKVAFDFNFAITDSSKIQFLLK